MDQGSYTYFQLADKYKQFEAPGFENSAGCVVFLVDGDAHTRGLRRHLLERVDHATDELIAALGRDDVHAVVHGAESFGVDRFVGHSMSFRFGPW